MNEKVISKAEIVRDCIFRSNACVAAGLLPDPLRELKRSTDFIFRPKMNQKRLAAGLRPDPLGELKRSPMPLAAVGPGKRTLYSRIKGHFTARRGWGGSAGDQREGVIQNPSSSEISYAGQNACVRGRTLAGSAERA